jgi:hypothetical protein
MHDLWTAFFPMTIALMMPIAVFVFLTVAVWAKQRRREREAFYRFELARKMVEKGEMSEERMMEIYEREASAERERRREGLRTGGLASLAAGLAMVIAFRLIDNPIAYMGLVPALIGAALLIGSFWSAKR